MNDMNVCGNYEALIGYLYDECEPAERQAVAAHVALCASCAEEIQALGDTRAHLVSWTPPALPLGFQITRTESDTPAHVGAAKVLRPAAWNRPLPAWAQVAAAVVIFAAGMSVNVVRSSGGNATAPVVAQTPVPALVAETPAVDDMTVTRGEFARLEQRLRAIEHADIQLASRTGDAVDQDELFARVSALVEERVATSEQRNLRMIARLAREIDVNRDATQRVSVMEGDVQDLQQAFRTAIAPSLAVRTSLTSGR